MGNIESIQITETINLDEIKSQCSNYHHKLLARRIIQSNLNKVILISSSWIDYDILSKELFSSGFKSCSSTLEAFQEKGCYEVLVRNPRTPETIRATYTQTLISI